MQIFRSNAHTVPWRAIGEIIRINNPSDEARAQNAHQNIVQIQSVVKTSDQTHNTGVFSVHRSLEDVLRV